jgi:hypothetical protein
MAKPSANKVANTFPVTVIIRAIANEAKLANNNVKITDKRVTTTLFLKLTSRSLSLSSLL